MRFLWKEWWGIFRNFLFMGERRRKPREKTAFACTLHVDWLGSANQIVLRPVPANQIVLRSRPRFYPSVLSKPSKIAAKVSQVGKKRGIKPRKRFHWPYRLETRSDWPSPANRRAMSKQSQFSPPVFSIQPAESKDSFLTFFLNRYDG